MIRKNRLREIANVLGYDGYGQLTKEFVRFTLEEFIGAEREELVTLMLS